MRLLEIQEEVGVGSDPEALPQSQAGTASLSGLRHNDSSGDVEVSVHESDGSSDEEIQTEANRLSKIGSYWCENPSTHARRS